MPRPHQESSQYRWCSRRRSKRLALRMAGRPACDRTEAHSSMRNCMFVCGYDFSNQFIAKYRSAHACLHSGMVCDCLAATTHSAFICHVSSVYIEATYHYCDCNDVRSRMVSRCVHIKSSVRVCYVSWQTLRQHCTRHASRTLFPERPHAIPCANNTICYMRWSSFVL